MKKVRPVIELLLLFFSLVIILAIMCDYYNVYVPGVVCLIPEHRRPSYIETDPPPGSGSVVHESVIIIDNTRQNTETPEPEHGEIIDGGQ